MAVISQSLTEDQRKFLEECETQFKDRFTEKDEEFMEVHKADLPRPPIVHPWWTPRANRGGRNAGGRRDFRRNNDYEDRRGVRGRYDNDSRGYGGEQSGYNDNRRGYNDDRQGYNINRRGYNDNRQGYNDNRQRYNDNKRGYNDDKQGYNDNRPGYNDDRQKHSDAKRRYEDQRGGRD